MLSKSSTRYSISKNKPDHYKMGIQYHKTKPYYMDTKPGLFQIGRGQVSQIPNPTGAST